MLRKIRKLPAALAIFLVTGLQLMPAFVQADESFSFQNGELDRPVGYREWVYVCTPLTPNISFYSDPRLRENGVLIR